MNKTFAFPMENGELSAHFGHSTSFAIIHTENGQITERRELMAPKHEHGALPVFLAQQGVDVVIAGGMGLKAQHILDKKNIEIRTGVALVSPEELVQRYFKGELPEGAISCNHC